MAEIAKKCGTCLQGEDFGMEIICCNPESENFDEVMERGDVCGHWRAQHKEIVTETSTNEGGVNR